MEKDLKLIEIPQLFHGCLHFRYNKKKYLYGVSEELLTFGEENGLLSKMNGTYEPSEREKKEKSMLLLKKEKSIMKVDFIIMPRKACEHQYLWHFENLFQKLSCQQFLILTENEHKNKPEYAENDFFLKQNLISLLQKDNESTFEQKNRKVQMFKEHENIIKKDFKEKKSEEKSKSNQASKIENIWFEEVEQIYEEDINQLIIKMCKKETKSYAEKSIFQNVDPLSLMKNISSLLNEIRHNSNYEKELQLTQEQIELKKQKLSEEILRISSSENVFYPTENQEAEFLFLPLTNMIGILHKHHIALINPSNLASWRLHYLNLPVSKVEQIILTRFSMSFVEFILAWSTLGEEEKSHSFLEVITLEEIYEKIREKLYEQFLWNDEMIHSKISFRIIPSSKNNQENSRFEDPREQFYNLGHLKICHKEDETNQKSWIIKFGDNEILFLNSVLMWREDWLKRFNFVIFDKINEEIKNELYGKSKLNQEISKKCVYNRSSSSKYRHRYFYCLNENNPTIRINSKIKVQETFIPEILNNLQKKRYHKVKLSPGESINCLDRNIIVVEGLVTVTNEFYTSENEEIKGMKLKETYVWLCLPADFTQHEMFANLSQNKIRNVKELIALKSSLILVEELDDEEFYENLQVSNQRLGKSELTAITSGIQTSFLTQNLENSESRLMQLSNNRILTSSSLMNFDELDIFDVASNSLIKIISPYSTNFQLSYTQIDEFDQQENSKTVEFFSPLHQFSQLFKRVTLESGKFINEDNLKAYFVIKGSLKWKHFQENELAANNQSFIGNLKYFYENKVRLNKDTYSNTNLKSREDIENENDEIVPIEVIKDTWALEADLNELHKHFFTKFPEISYWMITKGKIFY